MIEPKNHTYKKYGEFPAKDMDAVDVVWTCADCPTGYKMRWTREDIVKDKHCLDRPPFQSELDLCLRKGGK